MLVVYIVPIQVHYHAVLATATMILWKLHGDTRIFICRFDSFDSFYFAASELLSLNKVLVDSMLVTMFSKLIKQTSTIFYKNSFYCGYCRVGRELCVQTVLMYSIFSSLLWNVYSWYGSVVLVRQLISVHCHFSAGVCSLLNYYSSSLQKFWGHGLTLSVCGKIDNLNKN